MQSENDKIIFSGSADFQRLLRSLRRARGFALYFAVCNVPALRERLLQEIAARTGRPAHSIDLSEWSKRDTLPDAPAVLQSLLQESESLPGDGILLVSGLEYLLPTADPGKQHDTLQFLNWKRNRFKQLDIPLLFAVPSYLALLIQENAPDFWDWHSGMYIFPAEEPERRSMFEFISGQASGALFMKETAREKRELLVLYRSLLEEYQSDNSREALGIKGELNGKTATLLYQLSEYEKALGYLERSLKISQETGDKAGEGRALNNISQIFKARGDYERTLHYLKMSLKIAQEIGDEAGEAITMNNISQIYQIQGDDKKTLWYLEESLKIFLKTEYKKGEGVVLNNLGQIHHIRGDDKTALLYWEASLKIAQEVEDKAGEARTMNNISQIYFNQGNYRMALGYLERSLKISQETGDKAGEGTILNNIAAIFQIGGDYEMALRHLERSLKISQETGDKAEMIPTLHNIAHIHFQNHRINQAMEKFLQAFQLARETQNVQGLFNVSRDLGVLLCQSGRTEDGLPLLRQALEIGRASGYHGTVEIESLLQQYNHN